MEENTATQQQEQEKPTFQALVTVQDAALAIWFDNMEDRVSNIVSRAQGFTQIRTQEEAGEVTALIQEGKAAAKDAIEKIKPFKDRVNDIKGQILDTEKRFVVPCKAQVEDHLKKVLSEYYDYLDAEKKKEEARLREEAEKERKKRLDQIGKKLDGLLDKVADLNDQKRLLEEQLEDESTTEEEAAEVRARIEAIEIKQGAINSSVVERQVQMQEAAVDTTVVVENRAQVAGLGGGKKKYKAVEVISPKMVLQQIIDGKNGLGIKTITFNLSKLSQAKNDGHDVQGVRFTEERDFRVKGA